jgi:hypothetical protein
MSSNTDESVPDEKAVDPQGEKSNENDNNQPREKEDEDDFEDVEQVTNVRLYLVEWFKMKKNDERAEAVLYQYAIEQINKMDPMPSSARDIIHSKEKMVEELKGLKETHLRNQAFYDQLLGLMLQSPDTDEEVTPTLPPIHRPVYYTEDGKKYYRNY